jgi:DNA end-binding protein Ku
MLDLARHIVEQKSGHFEPERFEDHHEAALAELLAKKQKRQPIAAAKKAAPSNVVNNLMDALRASLKESGETKIPAKKATKKRKAG